MSRMVRYRKSVKGQRVEEPKPVEVDGIGEWEVKKILNKRLMQESVKYLVRCKGFTVEYDTWEKKEDSENTKELMEDFKGKIEAEVRR